MLTWFTNAYLLKINSNVVDVVVVVVVVILVVSVTSLSGSAYVESQMPQIDEEF